jgi:hypothetical protein
MEGNSRAYEHLTLQHQYTITSFAAFEMPLLKQNISIHVAHRLVCMCMIMASAVQRRACVRMYASCSGKAEPLIVHANVAIN